MTVISSVYRPNGSKPMKPKKSKEILGGIKKSCEDNGGTFTSPPGPSR
jgi:hypothetical protein